MPWCWMLKLGIAKFGNERLSSNLIFNGVIVMLIRSVYMLASGLAETLHRTFSTA